MNSGHTTQLGPHQESLVPVQAKKKISISNLGESREHLLILLVLFLFSVNIALAFSSFGPTRGVDGIPTPASSASVILSNIFHF